MSRSSRAATLLVAAHLGVAVPAPQAGPGGGGAPAWSPPVAGPIVRAYAPPPAPYAPGHRGIDFAAAPGTTVRAVGGGVVVFAGQVGGTLHVVVDHGDGVRTGVSFLAAVSVSPGQAVRRGDPVGTAGGAGEGHAPGVVHLGLRRGETYLDPALLFGAPDLAATVRLVPVEEPAGVRLGPDGRGPGGTIPAWMWVADLGAAAARAVQDGEAWTTGAAGAALDAVTGFVARGAATLDGLPAPFRSLAERLVAGLVAPVLGPVREAVSGFDPSFLAVELLTRGLRAAGVAAPPAVVVHAAITTARALAERTAEWLGQRGTCTSGDVPPERVRSRGHGLVAVGGFNSATGAGGRTFDLAPEALGFGGADVTWFSYRGPGRPYRPADTWGDLGTAARRLAAQLRAEQRARPGRPVDLVGHSQGGLVIEAFLKLEYRPEDPSFPPLGAVVTLASPHRGAPLAVLARRAGRSALGPVAAAAARALDEPPPGTVAVEEMAGGSGFLDLLARRPLPPGVRVTTVGAVDDVMVPVDRTRLAGAEHVVVDPAGLLDDHARIVDDPEALRAVRLALAGMPPPCLGLADALRSAIVPAAEDEAVALTSL